MSILVLVNPVTIVQNGSAAPLRPGDIVQNAAAQAAVQAAGGVLVDSTLPSIAAVLPIVRRLNAKGGSELAVAMLMLTAYTTSVQAAEIAADITYVDGAPAFGSTNVQGALDAAKAALATNTTNIGTNTTNIGTLTGEMAALLPVQVGGSALTLGVSPNIAATIGAGSRVVVTRSLANASAALGELTAVKSAGSPGYFVVSALTPGTPAAVLTTDVSSFDWAVIG